MSFTEVLGRMVGSPREPEDATIDSFSLDEVLDPGNSQVIDIDSFMEQQREPGDEKQDGDTLTNAGKTNTTTCNRNTLSANEAINTNNTINTASLVTGSFDSPSIAEKNNNKRKVNGNMNSEERGKSKKGTSDAKTIHPRSRERWKVLHQLLSDDEWHDIVGWGETGLSFWISAEKEDEDEVRSFFETHSDIISNPLDAFRRYALNWGVRRLDLHDSKKKMVFYHHLAYFQKDDISLIAKMKSNSAESKIKKCKECQIRDLKILELTKELEDTKLTSKQKTSSAFFYPNEVTDSECDTEEDGCDDDIGSDDDLDITDEDVTDSEADNESDCDDEINSDDDLDATDEDRSWDKPQVVMDSTTRTCSADKRIVNVPNHSNGIPNIPMAYDTNMVAGILLVLVIAGIVVNINIY